MIWALVINAVAAGFGACAAADHGHAWLAALCAALFGVAVGIGLVKIEEVCE